MTKSAIKNLKEKNGSSKAAILKYILQNYKVGDNIKSVSEEGKEIDFTAHIILQASPDGDQLVFPNFPPPQWTARNPKIFQILAPFQNTPPPSSIDALL